jgi:hypothetical protein
MWTTRVGCAIHRGAAILSSRPGPTLSINDEKCPPERWSCGTSNSPRNRSADPDGRKRPFLGKVAVSGELAESDCVSSPDTVIFDRGHQDRLDNEVIYPAR